MKKLIILLLISTISPAFAAGDWESIYESYDEARYEKPVSEEEFQNAIKTIEKYQKKDKKKEKAKKEAGEQQDFTLTLDAPSRQEPLLMLASDVIYNEQVIERGFYLVSSINKDNKHFIRLSRGEGRVVADIEANYFKSEHAENNIFSKILENDILKLTYTDKDLILEAYLWIQ